MARTRTKIIVFFAGLFILLSGFASSYFWLTQIYLPEIINADENARLYQQWFETDTFRVSHNEPISHTQLIRFLHVNESLTFLLQRLRHQFEENSWALAIDMIQMRPEWLANKYLALKKHGMTPREYDWIADCVSEFWIYRWKQESAAKLEDYGLELKPSLRSDKLCAENYKLFLAYEDELNKIFEILWPREQADTDSI